MTKFSLDEYRPAVDRYDECKAGDGTMRPSWETFAKHIETLGINGMSERTSTIDQLLSEHGTTFMFEDAEGSQNRPWNLSAVPLIIDSSAWAKLESGLAQRTRLLEAVLKDLLGRQRLIKERIIPAEILAANPMFQRAYHNLPSLGGIRLHITATDIARASDGSWWVVSDRTRAPSGLGYLLENRIITSRVFPHLVRQGSTRRLAKFFESLRNHLRSLAPEMRDNPRVALLTRGEDSYRGFEDAYLARYLGLTLVQGTDLAIRGGQLNLKTLGGLLPIEVLWRHVSDRKCDPLELGETSREGVSGLLRSVRGGHVAVANAIGSVMAQTPALMPFLAGANEFLFSEKLTLPSVATYWCGGATELNFVLANLETLSVRNAFGENSAPPIIASELSIEARKELVAAIKRKPFNYVAQEKLLHSTTPVWKDNHWQPWHVALRCFQLQTNRGVEVLPGAMARLSPTENQLGRSGTSGQLTQDVWVASDQPVDNETTLLPSPDATIVLKRSGDELPSRVAEHLFWLGRYAERGESIARLLRSTLIRLASENELDALPEVPRLIAALAAIGQIEPDYAIAPLEVAMPKLEDILPASVLDVSQPRGLQSTIRSVVHNASIVRDRLSIDAYRIIQHAEADLNAPLAERTIGRLIERMNGLIGDLLAFAGVISESFTRTHAWQFLEIGRRIERAYQTAELLSATLVPVGEGERAICEAVLETSDSLMTYRSRYLNLVQVAPTLDLLVTDESNPRSIRYQLDEIARVFEQLPNGKRVVGLGVDEKIAFDMLHHLRMADPNVLSNSGDSDRRVQLNRLLEHILDGLPELSNAIAARYLIHTGTTQSLTGVSPTVSLLHSKEAK
ncbi:circularly permuted type 2 ATP-grasp protein [Rubripirellula reticaptiva]|uniref:Uncharacterized protein n=1 Tax=Rubripirellula reticaptiva TaxID=2528013 RepID=A0A5C6ES37_9BACT|nr:circularly permuted type 2 ATP-grasp protein [Rubripirellula reticaptiva]TWU51798.1 hypothetical protein Poly59_33930 [Rubripirellula reticaptiva]